MKKLLKLLKKSLLEGLGILALGEIPETWAQDFETEESYQEARFIDRKAEGWFWYQEEEPEEPPKEEIMPEEKKVPPAPVVPSKKENSENKKEASPLGSVAWVRENLPKYLDKAIDDPTPENITAYLLLQRYSMDKSSKFAEKVQLVTLGNPYLDETVNGPNTQGASAINMAIAKRNLEKVRATLMKKIVLLYVFDEGELSLAESGVIHNYENHTGFTVIPVSATGKPLQNGLFPDFVTDTNIKKLVNVATLPAVFIVGANKKPISVLQGITAEPDLDYRVINVAYREGLISEEDYRSLRTSKVASHSLADKVNLMEALEDMDFPEASDADGLIPVSEINAQFQDLYLQK